MLNRLTAWREAKRRDAIAVGVGTFMHFPDEWLADPHWICTLGHVSGRFLKGDGGDRCLVCRAPVILGPPITEGALALELARTANAHSG